MVDLFYAERIMDKCSGCGACKEIISCSCLSMDMSDCVGCGACYLACPNMAIHLKPRKDEFEEDTRKPTR